MVDKIAIAKSENEHFLLELEKVVKFRQYFAKAFADMANSLEEAERIGERDQSSGILGLDQEIQDLKAASQNLDKEVFRLLVLGDIKQGKTTLINALIGDNILPVSTVPCTAVITIIKYGESKRVVMHFDDGHEEEIDFETFKRDYTIDSKEVKAQESIGSFPFNHVEFAEVFYPLPLLQQGIEIIDSPGLNDTDTRNRTSLSYINNCHAVLFVMSAIKFLTLEEQRYLDDYISDRGLAIFFIINQWDRIRDGLINRDDPQALAEQEKMLRDRAFINLSYYCEIDDQDLYTKRVFEVSALDALNRMLKTPPEPLDGTGFPSLILELNRFLTEDRVKAEMHHARIIAREIFNRVDEIVELRIPLLGQTEEEIHKRIEIVEPMFNDLQSICQEFTNKINEEKDKTVEKIQNNFEQYVNKLIQTFEADFQNYHSDLKVIDFLRKNKRKEFEYEVKQSFVKYISNKISIWSRSVEKELLEKFQYLDAKAKDYGIRYDEVSHNIAESLTDKVSQVLPISKVQDQELPSWVQWSNTTVSALSGKLPGSWLTLGEIDFDFQQIAMNVGTAIGVSAALMLTFGAALTPIGASLIGLGISTWQIDRAKQTLMNNLKEKFAEALPIVAREQTWIVRQTVIEYFKSYESQVILRMQNDIASRKLELENLLKQQRSNTINRDNETKRLNNLRKYIKGKYLDLDRLCDTLYRHDQKQKMD